MQMTKETLHDIKHPDATGSAEVSGGSAKANKSVGALPYEAQRALFQVFGTRGGPKGGDKAKDDDGKKADKPETIVTGTATAYAASEGTGSSTIVTSSPAVTTMYDQLSPTSIFLRLVEQEPDTDPLILWGRAVASDPNVGGEISQVKNPSAAATGPAKRRFALIIANGDYSKVAWLDDLENAQPDGAGIAGYYAGRDHGTWSIKHIENQTGAQSVEALQEYAQLVRPGDDIFISLHGHGSEFGFTGVDEEPLPWTALSEFATAAVAGGWNCTIVADACHSGRVQQYIAKEPGYEEAGSVSAMGKTGEGRHGKAWADSAEKHKNHYREAGPTDYPGPTVRRLAELLDHGGSDAQVYAQLESVAGAFTNTTETRTVFGPERRERYKQASRALVALRGHKRLKDPELADLFKQAQVAAYVLKKKMEKAPSKRTPPSK